MSKNIINGYEIVAPWECCGNGRYSFAKKNGENFFIKELKSPRYPVSGSEAIRRERIKLCEEFIYDNKNRYFYECAGNIFIYRGDDYKRSC